MSTYRVAHRDSVLASEVSESSSCSWDDDRLSDGEVGLLERLVDRHSGAQDRSRCLKGEAGRKRSQVLSRPQKTRREGVKDEVSSSVIGVVRGAV